MIGQVVMVGWPGKSSEILSGHLARNGFRVRQACNQSDLEVAVSGSDVVLLWEDVRDGVRLPLLEALNGFNLESPLIVVTARPVAEQVILAIRLGALDVLSDPVDPERLLSALQQAMITRRAANSDDVSREECPPMLGSSSQMFEVFKQLGVAASNDLTVLLTGETGVGKEVSALSIHKHSVRSHGPFVAINCTAVPDGLLEAELFGYARGAFTNATRDTPGKVEAASGGTLLLDEIGDMPLGFQAKLLRFLEDKKFYRLGETTTRRADVRIIATTNREMLAEVEAGRIRSDLYYRLAQLPIVIPPLRERPDDILTLVRAFVAEVNLALGLLITGVSPEAERCALTYHWPGNVRELKNVVYQSAVATRAGRIEQFVFSSGSGPVHGGASAGGQSADWAPDLDMLIRRAVRRGSMRQLQEEFERATLKVLLESFRGNRSRIAEELGISRNTLRSKLREHSLQDDS